MKSPLHPEKKITLAERYKSFAIDAILVDFPNTWQTKSIYSVFAILLSHRS